MKDETALKEILAKNRKRYNAEKRLFIICKSVGNPDHNQNPNRSISPTAHVHIQNYEQASAIVRCYIEHYELGGGNWTGGQVYESENDYEAQKITAYVSYNGRVWKQQIEVGKETEEITIDPDKKLNYYNELKDTIQWIS